MALLPDDNAAIKKLIEDALHQQQPTPLVVPSMPSFNIPHPKSTSDWVNLMASIGAAIMGVLAVYHQQTTPDPVKPPVPVVVNPVTPVAPDPNAAATSELRDAIAQIKARLDASDKGKK